MDIPEMKKYWDDLCKRAETNKLGNDKKLFKRSLINFGIK